MAITASELEEFLEAWENADVLQRCRALAILRRDAERREAEAKQKAEKPKAA